MPHPSVRSEAEAHRASGGSSVPNLMPAVFAEKDDHSGTQEDRRRRAAATAEPAAVVPALGGAIPPLLPAADTVQPPTQAPPIDLRFHKWGPGYVTVAKPHLFGEDPVILPAYSDSVVAGYAKAVQLATRDNQRVSLIIIGGGGAFKENLVLTHPLVDVFGWGNPTIEGHCQIGPMCNPLVEGITFHTPLGAPIPLSSQPCMSLPFTGPFTVDPMPLGVPRFSNCRFYGAEKVFLSQRMFAAENCTFWHEPMPDGTFIAPMFEIAPVMIEMETPQRWWSFMRNCRLYAGLQAGPPEDGVVFTSAKGYAIKVSSGPSGLAPMPNLISYDGVFRSTPGAAASGAIESGVMLSHCDIFGSSRIREWTLAHEHCLIYSGLPIVETGQALNCYAWISGHDYLDGGDNFNGRQFGIALFDDCDVHSYLVAMGVKDSGGRAGFNGGAAAFFRNSEHFMRNDGAVAGAPFATDGAINVFNVETAKSSSGATVWGVGAGIILSDTGSSLNVTQSWHPLFG